MANSLQDQGSEPPKELANVPPNVSAETRQTRLIVKAVEDTVSDIKGDIKDIKSYRHSDFVYIISIFGIGFMTLAAMIVVAYLRIDDKLTAINNNAIRTETKLDDLLRRVPPSPFQIPRR